MYFSFFEPKNWRKRSAEVRRHNCAVLPLEKSHTVPYYNTQPVILQTLFDVFLRICDDNIPLPYHPP